MKIYFCDGCNESLPLAEVQAGQVTAIKGKLFCRNCIPPGAVSGPAPAGAPARSASFPLLGILVLLLAGWTVWRDRAVFFEVAPTSEQVPETSPLSELERQVEQLESALNQASADGDQRGMQLTKLKGDLEGLRAADVDQALTTARLEDEIDRVAASQTRAGQLVERVQLTANRLDSQERRLEALSDAVAAHQEMLRMGALPMAAAEDGGEAAQTEAPIDPARMAAIEGLRRQLLSPEPDLRFDGVDQVEAGNYRELAPELVGLLQDEDLFVRLHAMNVLGNFAYEEAVPALFAVIEDDSNHVRKKAAETLVRLTGYDPGYDPKASRAERDRIVKKWSDWYAAR